MVSTPVLIKHPIIADDGDGSSEAVVDEELLAEDPTDNADDEPVSKKICRRSR